MKRNPNTRNIFTAEGRLNRHLSSDASKSYAIHDRSSIQAGKITATAQANTVVNVTCNFINKFEVIPTVVITAQSTTPETVVKEVTVNNVSASAFKCYFYRTDNSTCTFHWIACETTQ